MTTSLGERTRTRHGTRRADAKRTEARLRVVYPFDLKATYALTGDRLVIGRRPDEPSQPRLSHPTVSRHHLVIEWDDRAGAHVGTDMGSRNGTWIDGSPAHGPRPLAANSVVRAGDVLLVYETGRGLADDETPGVSLEAIPGEAPPVCMLRAAMARAARDPSPVLLIGETGTGKELIGGEIHRLSRREGDLVTLNCAALSPHLVESQLFGHVRGAFTGADQPRRGMVEEAAGGTLFLDEIGDLSSASQVKLLRLLQEGEFFALGSDRPKRLQARVVLATHHDLAARQAAGTFRRDLYFRLCTHQIRVPPLRERKGDIAVLLEHFLEEAARSLGKKKPTAPKELPQLLATYSFPGNVRELKAMVYDAVSLHKQRILSMDSFVKAIGHREEGEQPSAASPDRNPFADVEQLPTFREAMGLLADEAMSRASGNQTMAARLLGISQPALSKRLKTFRE